MGRIVIAVCLIMAGLCVKAPAQDLQHWRHGVIEPKGDAGFSLMVAHHGFAGKNGLKLKTLIVKSGATAIKALLAGEVDSIEASPGSAILAGAYGADIKIIGCNLPGVPHVVMARSSIASVQDLKGKLIAVSAPGSLPNLLINMILEKHDIRESDVRFANLGSDLNRFEALVAGIADAGVVASEFVSVAPSNLKVLAVARDILPNYVRLCLMMRGETLTTRRAAAIQFVTAEMEALQFALTHRDETIKLTREIIRAKASDPRLTFVYEDTIMQGAVDPLIKLPFEKLQWMHDQLLKAGILKRPFDLNQIIDTHVREIAVKRLDKQEH